MGIVVFSNFFHNKLGEKTKLLHISSYKNAFIRMKLFAREFTCKRKRNYLNILLHNSVKAERASH